MTLYIGIDLHKTQFTTCIKEKTGNKYSEYSTEEKGYTKFLEQVQAWQKQGYLVKVGVESTGNTRYFKSVLETIGIEVIVINTLKFKVVNESVKKTDKHDAATIAEFLEKDMLPESKLCSESSEQLRRLLNVRTTLVKAIVSVKNQVHGLLTGLGMKDRKSSLQSKRGRQLVLTSLLSNQNECSGLIVQPLFDTIEQLSENVKKIEKELERLVNKDRMVELLMSIPGCGLISASTIRAYTDDIGRFSSSKKYASYAGLAPIVQNSNEKVWHGRITKRGPAELRTALVQVVLGMRRCRKTTHSWRLMKQYELMKQHKGSGRSIIATARKLSNIIWNMLSKDQAFNSDRMCDKKLELIAEQMRSAVKI